MKRLLTMFMITGIIASFAIAQEEEGSEPVVTKHRSAKVGGAGGFMPSWGLFKFTEVNNALTQMGLPKFSDAPMYMSGGIGYGYPMFIRNLRIGGFGSGGTVTQSYDKVNPATSAKTRYDVEYGISYGGFLIDYVVPLASRLDFSAGISFGGGTTHIKLTRDNGGLKSYDGLLKEFGKVDSATGNYTRTISGTFFTMVPNVNIEYALLPWFQLRVGVAYPIMTNPSWTMENGDKIANVPAGLKADGPVINGGIMFGYFN
ncbi:MAG: hypothetical protein NTV54_00330 [Ignavibacteriales bacterium]|nr:hypothetical protein [Ignavibacteriales bacterium]